MTEAILNQQEVTKRNIIELLSQLTNTYQNTRRERKEILTEFSPENEEFSLLEEIELFTVNLRGYASQIAATGKIVNQENVISQLQAMRVFSVSPIGKFYFSSNGKYEQIKNYIRMLDYLRLLLLEYLQSY
ncbi:hypothetical protein VB711_05195 [Cronbergia sp. UHCC 0137]|uniref:hypothetical protein n=1 Tax=Cronbergia sp. UHCC 0137 TaxID=3110239 RepID=UPI002B1FF529|nr:hypothetical protein [Cronbergia sp. UHCC 0137]MEA5617235.1 hypothetical protein [Cronbergia sp. UHCC 0137]